jgi:hypothetical protein
MKEITGVCIAMTLALLAACAGAMVAGDALEIHPAAHSR